MDMTAWDDVQLQALQASYADWDIWTVPIYMPRHTRWCAKPTGHPISTISVDSPEELIKAIAERTSSVG
jgi:hypothetical protein